MNIPDSILDKLLTYSTKPEQKAFLSGYALGTENSPTEAIESTLATTTIFTAPSAIPTVTILDPPIPSTAQEFRSPKKSFRREHVGLRATILRLLYTGATGYNQLERASAVMGTPFTSTLNKLRVTGFVEEKIRGLYSLTDAGREEALFFVAHPHAKIHYPGKRTN